MSSDYEKAVHFVAEHQKASTSFLKQHLRLSDSKVNRFLKQMEKDGVISKPSRSGARDVLVDPPPAPVVPQDEHAEEFPDADDLFAAIDDADADWDSLADDY